MVAFFLILLLLIAVLVWAPTAMIRKHGSTTLWDFIYPFTGVIVWILLCALNVGSTMSLANIIEPLWIAALSITVPWGRWLMSRFLEKQVKVLSLALTLLPMVVAVIIRLVTPTLPE